MSARFRSMPSIPTASMSDVAFLLLVFFLLVTAIRDDRGLRTDLPPLTSLTTPVRDILHIQIAASGAMAVEGEPATPEAVREKVAAFASGGGPVDVQADRSAPYAAYVSTLVAVLLGHRDVGATPRLSLPQPVE